MEIKIPNFDEIEKTYKKRRNQFLNLIIVLLCGICYVIQNDTMLLNMGWFMVIVSSLFLFLFYIFPKIYLIIKRIIYKIIYKLNKQKISFVRYEISLNITRQTVSKHINLLKTQGYINIPKRGKIQITEKGYKIIKKLQ